MQYRLKQTNIDPLKRLLEDFEGLYEFTQLSHESMDFSAGEIKREMERGKQRHSLYQVDQKLLPDLGFSNESIKYYASLVDYYSVYRLKQQNLWIGYLYLLCFIYYRFHQKYVNLINTSVITRNKQPRLP
ncbi:hypothetical protein [Bacillus sp. 2205SS5-2]|uniref:hypothetical protein n=1 Tax=Bacillus sp. 2205SS5-2 TaxID=3109031 RepID=UPI003005B8CA